MYHIKLYRIHLILTHVRFVFISSCLLEGLSHFFHFFFYIICVCLRMLMSNTYGVVCLLCFSLSCVPYVANFSGLSPLLYSPFSIL